PRQLATHLPLEHSSPAAHATPQPPQLLGSLAVSMQVGDGPGPAHAAIEPQNWPVGPWHTLVPAGQHCVFAHGETHLPATHALPAPHTLPQLPQLAVSVLMSAQ